MPDNDIEVNFGGQGGDLIATMTQIRYALQGLANPIRGLRDNLGELAEGFLAAFAVEKILNFTEKMADLGSQALRMSAQMGESVEVFSSFQAVLAGFGGDTDNSSRSIMMLERNLAAAQSGATTAAAAYKALGITQVQLKDGTQNLDGFIDLLRQKWQEFGDNENKSAIFTEALGGSFRQLLPYLMQTDEAVDGMRERMAETGSVLSGPMAKGMDDTGSNLAVMWAAIKGLGITLFEAFKPALDAIINGITILVESFNNAIKGTGIFHDALTALVLVLDTVIGAIDLFSTAIYEAWQIVAGAVTAMIESFQVLAQVMKDVFTFNWSAAKADAATGLNLIENEIKTRMNNILAAGKDYAARVSAIYANLKAGGVDTSGGSAETGGDKKNLGVFDPQAYQQAAAEAKAAADLIMKSAEAAYQTQIKYYEGLLSTGKLTYDQLAAAEVAAQQQLLATQVAALKKELAVQGQEPARYKEIKDQIATLEAQSQEKIAQIKNQAATNNQKLALDELAWEQKTNQQSAEFSKQMLDQKLTEEGASASQRLAVQRAELDQELTNLRSSFAAQAAQYEVGTKQYLTIWEKYYQDQEKLQQQWAKDVQQANNQTLKSFESAANSMSTAFSGMVRSVLQGTTTWGQAFKQMVGNLVLDLMGAIVKMAAEWAAHQAYKLLLELTTDTAVEAAHAATAATTAATDDAVDIKPSVLKHAGSAAAAVYDDVSQIPYVGWILAPIAAAAAFTAVAAFGSFAQGSYNVPSDMLAMVHAGEMIVPSSAASLVRSGVQNQYGQPSFASAVSQFGGGGGSSGADGGVSVQFHVSAIDAPGVNRFFMQNSGTIARAVSSQIRQQNSGLFNAIRSANGPKTSS